MSRAAAVRVRRVAGEDLFRDQEPKSRSSIWSVRSATMNSDRRSWPHVIEMRRAARVRAQDNGRARMRDHRREGGVLKRLCAQLKREIQ